MGIDPTEYEIQLVSTVTGERRTFISGGGNHEAPVWSIDGKSIFYISNHGNKPQVLRKLFLESDPQKRGQLISDLPDGSIRILGLDSMGTIYLGAYDRGGQDVYYGKVDWDNNSVEEVTKIISPPFRGSRRAVFAPSENKIAFIQKGRGFTVRPGWQTPVVRDLVTGVEKLYPTQMTLRDEPLWSADGTALYFAAPPERSIGEEADQVWSFYRLDLNKASYTNIGKAASAGLVRMVGATSNTIIYFSNTLGQTNIASIFSLDLSSKDNVLLHRIEKNELHDVALSPDGSRLAVAINETDGSKGIYILVKGKTTLLPITTIRSNQRPQLMWLSTGDAIISSGRIKGKQSIWRIPIDGSTPQTLDISATDVTEVRLSTDGHSIAFTRTNRQPNQILALK
jgi:WD40 repeat protein